MREVTIVISLLISARIMRIRRKEFLIMRASTFVVKLLTKRKLQLKSEDHLRSKADKTKNVGWSV